MKDILVVEDNNVERERVVKVLETAGYKIESASTYKEAEHLLESNKFRLAILDIGLEDKSGTHLFQSIMSSKQIPYVLVLTGNPSAHLKDRFLREGATDYIVKGSIQAQSQNLLERIKEILGESFPSEDCPDEDQPQVMRFDDFICAYLSEKNRALFADHNGEIFPCQNCGSRDYIIDFNNRPQCPPSVEGLIICCKCGTPCNPQLK